MITHPDIKPGDAIYARTSNIYGFVIRIAQALRWWKYKEQNHMAIVVKVDADGQIWVIQMARKCELVKLEEVAPNGKLWWKVAPSEIDADRAVNYAYQMLGTDYGVITIGCIGINLCLPESINIDIQAGMSLICSALVAKAWEHGGWICHKNASTITPADMYGLQGGNGTRIQ